MKPYPYKAFLFWKILAGPNGGAVWGVGFNSMDAETMGSNPA
jgi:hypothetical protein